MKTVYLVRHAEAVGKDKGIPDADRTLVKRGIKSAARAAESLRQCGVRPDLWMSSHAHRALETAHLYAKEYEVPVEAIQLRPELYEAATGAAFLDVLRGVGDEIGSVMLFGHEPSLSQGASELLSEPVGPLPKCGVVGISLEIEQWAQLAAHSGTLTLQLFPLSKQERAEAIDAIRRRLTRQLTAAISGCLESVDSNAARKLDARIRKASAGLADDFFGKARKRDLINRTRATVPAPTERETA